MTINVPSVVFNNGIKCPIVGFGTFRAEADKVYQAVKDAIDCGYRHLDCAHIYRNEKEIGQAIKEKIDEGIVKREDLFITSKLWNTYHKKELVEPALKVTLSNLGIDYLDLYLIHWPYAFKEGEELIPKDDTGKIIFSDVPFIETWIAMEDCVKSGLVRSIGVSNFNSLQIQQILDIATIKPVNNQVECHVYLNQSKLLNFCKSHEMTLTAYAPLGSPTRVPEIDLEFPPLGNPVVNELAAKYNKSPAQILIKFHAERGIISIPKSTTKSRIQSNIDIFDFNLTADDLKKLEQLDCNGRTFVVKGNADNKYYPFHAEF